MKTADQPAPQARDDGLIVQELAEELLIYDLHRHRAHSLNRVAAWAWRHSDGRTTVSQMAALLRQELAAPVDEAAIQIALQRLGRVHLLRERFPAPPSTDRTSRRALIRSLAMAGGLATITSIVAPEASAAGSVGAPCTNNGSCTTGGCCCCAGSPNNFAICTSGSCDTNPGGNCDLACRARGTTAVRCNGC
jgi:hypothetical protein